MEVKEAASTIASYTYDALNRRVTETSVETGVETRYVYDGGRVIEEYAEGVLNKTFVYGAYVDDPLMMETASGERYFYLKDRRYSITALADKDGAVVERYEYSAFGLMTVYDDQGTDITAAGSAYGNPYGYTGRRWDKSTGLWYYRNRMYSPVVGRFMQRDPAGYVDGMNLYAYVRNNPVGFVDPSGMFSLMNDFDMKGSAQDFMGSFRYQDLFLNNGFNEPGLPASNSYFSLDAGTGDYALNNDEARLCVLVLNATDGEDNYFSDLNLTFDFDEDIVVSEGSSFDVDLFTSIGQGVSWISENVNAYNEVNRPATFDLRETGVYSVGVQAGNALNYAGSQISNGASVVYNHLYGTTLEERVQGAFQFGQGWNQSSGLDNLNNTLYTGTVVAGAAMTTIGGYWGGLVLLEGVNAVGGVIYAGAQSAGMLYNPYVQAGLVATGRTYEMSFRGKDYKIKAQSVIYESVPSMFPTTSPEPNWYGGGGMVGGTILGIE